MNVLVTGAAGLYGIHLVHELLTIPEMSHVVGVDNLSRKYLDKSPFLNGDVDNEKFTLVKKDFRNITSEELNNWSIDTVVHLAAYVSVPESMKDPKTSKDYFLNNELGTFTLMQTLLQTNKHPLLIYASSGKVYGDPQYLPIDIDHPQKPGNVYGATKLAAEKHLMVMHYAHDYPLVVVRNFNTFGPNQNVFADGAVIPLFITKALKDEPITIHGAGEQSRDFHYVEDNAHAYAMLCHKGIEHSGKIFNLASGTETSINELAETIISLTNSKSPIKHLNVRTSDLMNMVADFSEINKAIGWEPVHSLEKGLEKCVTWYRRLVE